MESESFGFLTTLLKSGRGLKLAFALAVGGTLLLVGMLRGGVFRRKLKELPFSNVHSIAVGQVRLKGRIRSKDGKMVTAPLSKQSCLIYLDTVEQHSNTSRSWNVVYNAGEWSNIVLEDGTGSIMLNVEGASTVLAEAFSAKNNWLSGKMQPGLKSFLDERGINWKYPWFGERFGQKPTRVSETVLTEGEECEVIGFARPYSNKGELVVSAPSKDRGEEGQLFIKSLNAKVKRIHLLPWTILGALMSAAGLVMLGWIYVNSRSVFALVILLGILLVYVAYILYNTYRKPKYNFK